MINIKFYILFFILIISVSGFSQSKNYPTIYNKEVKKVRTKKFLNKFTCKKEFWFALFKPTAAFAINKATKRTNNLLDSVFTKINKGSSKENAFKHAIWNFYIIKYYLDKKPKKIKRATFLAEKFTDIHEYCNKTWNQSRIDSEMDLHNNKIGRNIFLENFKNSSEKIMIAKLYELYKKAILVEKNEFKFDDLDKLNLIYLE